jgi:hypothetical protein
MKGSVLSFFGFSTGFFSTDFFSTGVFSTDPVLRGTGSGSDGFFFCLASASAFTLASFSACFFSLSESSLAFF